VTVRTIVASVYDDDERDERPLFELARRIHRTLASLRRLGLVTRTPGSNGHEYVPTTSGRQWLAADRAA
jgi:hypothetical protein